MTVHLHAHDGFTTSAVGTYNAEGDNAVFLHGEDHLRGVTDVYETPAAGIAAFQNIYGPAVRPGPTPATTAERRAADALKPLSSAVTAATLRKATKDRPRAAASVEPATIEGHEALLNTFLASHRGREKYRTWGDNCSYANHESLTLRAELNHEAAPHETAWQIAAYASPIGDLVWNPSATTTPVAFVRDLLENAAHHLGPTRRDPGTRQARHPGHQLAHRGWLVPTQEQPLDHLDRPRRHPRPPPRRLRDQPPQPGLPRGPPRLDRLAPRHYRQVGLGHRALH
ncbi:hypothetical protein ACFV1B_14905 [Streptomyces sp. NPDC059637]|uniref:hypothetical protein n=1 Tax=Streptomyces sp. NPDC059637 TaxID=3347752 RepID=UPI0036845F7A